MNMDAIKQSINLYALTFQMNPATADGACSHKSDYYFAEATLIPDNDTQRIINVEKITTFRVQF